MTGYSIGDYVLLRAKVIAVHGSDIGYSVELFSKTDQYAAMVRPDLVVDKVEPPPMDEPDRDSLVMDADGDLWRYKAGSGWAINRTNRAGISWDDLQTHGPLRIYEATS